MSKKVKGYIKLMVPAGKANSAPPLGPALRQHGVNVVEFCNAFNKKTANMDQELKLAVVITVYADGSFTFHMKVTDRPGLLREAPRIYKSKFRSAKTGRIVKPSPAAPRLGRDRIQEAVRSVVRREDRAQEYSH